MLEFVLLKALDAYQTYQALKEANPEPFNEIRGKSILKFIACNVEKKNSPSVVDVHTPVLSCLVPTLVTCVGSED